MEERILTRRAGAERARVLRDLRRLQRTSPPASAPFPLLPNGARVTAG